MLYVFLNFIILKKQVFLFLFLLSQLSSGHEDDPHTVQYTKETFADEINKNNNFVMFYAPWCGHCQRLIPTWAQLAQMYDEENTNIRIAKVDCTVDSSLCSENDVTGYPTLRFFKMGQSKGIKFRGTRDLPSLTAFINEQLGSMSEEEEEEKISPPEPVNSLLELSGESFHAHIGKGYHFVKFYAPWCGHCQSLAPTWEELANGLSNDDTVSISKIDCTLFKGVCEEFEIKGYPTLLWIEDGKKVDKYTGQRTYDDLKIYVSTMLAKSIDQTDTKEDNIDTLRTVLSLTGDSFEHSVGKGISFVKFFAPWCGHCKRLAPTWEELGRKFFANENVHIAKVDCTLNTSKQLCYEQEVDGFPTLYLYRNGRKVSEYNGSRTLDDLYGFVMNHLNSHEEL